MEFSVNIEDIGVEKGDLNENRNNSTVEKSQNTHNVATNYDDRDEDEVHHNETDFGDLDELNIDEPLEIFLKDKRRKEMDEEKVVILLLIISRFISNLGRTTWIFFNAIILVVMTGQILASSIYSVVLLTTPIFFSPFASQIVDTQSRIKILVMTILGSGIVYIISGGVYWVILDLLNLQIMENTLNWLSVVPFLCLYLSIILLNIMLCFAYHTLKLSIEEEWISCIYPIDGYPQIHSKFKISDLISSSISPLLLIPIFMFVSYSSSCIIITSFIVLLLSFEFLILRFIMYYRKELSHDNIVNDKSNLLKDLFPGNPLPHMLNMIQKRKSKFQHLFYLFVSNFLLSFWFLDVDVLVFFVSFLFIQNMPIYIISSFCFLFIVANLNARLMIGVIIRKFGAIITNRLILVIAATASTGIVPLYFFGGPIGWLCDLLVFQLFFYCYFQVNEEVFKKLEMAEINIDKSMKNVSLIAMNITACFFFYGDLFIIFCGICVIFFIAGVVIYLFWSKLYGGDYSLVQKDDDGEEDEEIGVDLEDKSTDHQHHHSNHH